MSGTTVNFVTGATATARSLLVTRLLAARPGWRAIAVSGCPCCIGRVATQITLVRVLREARPDRVLLEVPDEQHLPALRRALGEWPLSSEVEPGRVIRLPEDEAIAPEALSA
jgi:hypothetical protein